MKRAVATELLEDAVPVLVLRLSEARLRQLFPVELTEANEWSEPEPAKGALIRLRSGAHILLMYGLVTSRATHLDLGRPARKHRSAGIARGAEASAGLRVQIVQRLRHYYRDTTP